MFMRKLIRENIASRRISRYHRGIETGDLHWSCSGRKTGSDDFNITMTGMTGMKVLKKSCRRLPWAKSYHVRSAVS